MIGRVLKSLAGLALAGSLAWSASPASATVKFDETGTGTFGPVLQNLDWAPGNSIAVGGVSAVEAWVTNEILGNPHGGADEQFTFFYQAVLSSFKEIGDISPNVMPDDTELTIVVGLREKVIGVAGAPGGVGTAASFRRVADTDLDFLEVYYDDGSGSNGGLVDEQNNLDGEGFNDGKLILRAEIIKLVDTVFTVSDDNAGPLDQTVGDNVGNGGINGDNDYPGIDTVQGNGSTTLTAKILDTDGDGIADDFDPLFFDFDPDSPGYIQLTMLQNIGVDLPFLSVDPSSGFVTAKNTGAIGTEGPAPDLTIGPPDTVGSLNGGPSPDGGPDIVFQTDTNQTFKTTIIPEPVSATLSLIGLGALALVARRRRGA